MTTDLSTNDHDRIQFVYQWIKEGERIGDLVFFNRGRFPGSFAIGNELVHWNQAFEHTLESGLVVRSPGVVGRQTLTIDLRGNRIEYELDHTMELGRAIFGDRPVIQVISPAGLVMLFSYRPTTECDNAWCRVIPTLLDEPKPYGMLLRHFERVRLIYKRCFWDAVALVFVVWILGGLCIGLVGLLSSLVTRR